MRVNDVSYFLFRALWMLELLKDVIAGQHEKRLLDVLFDGYNVYERPVANEKDALIVSFSANLQQIIDVNEKEQLITTNLWLSVVWSDYRLSWTPADYNNISSFNIPISKVWKPDILMYSSADQSFDGTFPVNAQVYSDGTISQIPPGIFKSGCPIAIKWFPFDDQKCELKFGSWTYDGSRIDLRLPEGATEGETSEFKVNGEWDLIGMPVKRNVLYYECCPEPYIDLTFSIHIRRRKLYYMINIVIPCIMLAALTLLTFCIPPDAGEKISFAFPAIRNVIRYVCCPEPYIDITYIVHVRRKKLYYLINLIIPTALLSILSLMVFNTPPGCGEKISLGVTILLSITVFLLLVSEALPATSDAVPLIAVYFACVMLMNALSVVFTVLVLNYHHRTSETHEMPNWLKKCLCQWLPWILRMTRPGHDFSEHVWGKKHQRRSDVEMVEKHNTSKSLLSNVKDEDDYSPSLPSSPNLNGTDFIHHRGKIECRSMATNDFSTSKYEMKAILKELRFITEKMRGQDDDDQISSDWKFAACVIDRLLLWFFAVFTIVSTLGCLLSAPNMFAGS